MDCRCGGGRGGKGRIWGPEASGSTELMAEER